MGLSVARVTFNLRVQWNSGHPLYAFRLFESENLPVVGQIAAGRIPKVSDRGLAAIYIEAGPVRDVAFNIQTMPGITAPTGIIYGNTRPRVAGSPEGAEYVIAADQTLLDEITQTAAPAMNLALGQPVVALYHYPFYSAASLTVNASNDDLFLNDVEIHGTVTLAY
jgi:hypothetical protein